ncbi:hypothetical protein BH09MYX1_BH09MYX1_20450 [soil metagenome]
MRKLRDRVSLLGLGVLAVSACADIDTSRALPQRGTIGEEVYGTFCDRLAAEQLREDLTGASFRGVCHKVNGSFSDKVDETLLPPATTDAVDERGNPVSIEKQQQDRARSLGRIGALVRRRADLIGAVDAAIPDVMVPVKDLTNPNLARTCMAPNLSGEDKLGRQVADMLARFQNLYNDGTMPQSTRSLAELLAAIEGDSEAQAALARVGARLGYRPAETSFGAARPSMAYPRLRDLANASLSVISSDSKPYDPNPQLDDSGNRIPVPGSASTQFAMLLRVMQQELRTVQADPTPAALVVTADGVGDRTVLSRPRGTLEALGVGTIAEDPAFGGGAARYIVRRDRRGFANVLKTGGILPAPFVDKDADGLADTDPLGRFVSSSGTAPPAPFYALGAAPATSYDTFGRSLASNALLYEYIDTSHTFSAAMMGNLKPLVDSDVKSKHESLMYMLGGAWRIMGERDGFPKTNKVYGDSKSGQVTVTYDSYRADKSPMLDLVYALGQVIGDPSTDATLEYTKILMQSHEADLARVNGAALAFKDIADKHPEAKIPAKATFWDEMIDVVIQIEKVPGLFEDVLRSLQAPESERLGGIYSKYMTYKDRISYDRNNLNGPAWNFDKNSATEMATPVDRTKPLTGANRSAFHKFVQAIHDAHGVTACNKAGAKVRAVLGSINVTMPIVGSYAECEVFKLDDLAKFYLDSIIGKATLYLRNDTLRNGILGIGAATVGLMQESSGIDGFWDATGSKTLRPRPQFLNRQVFFDLAKDSPQSGDKNYRTNRFLSDLMGPHSVGSVVCPERIIPDPVPGAPDAANDGQIHGLRQCQSGDAYDERDADATMVWEDFGFYTAMFPLISAFAAHNREDLLLGLMEVWYRHWADDSATKSECDPTGTAKTNPRFCNHSGVVSYEPLLAEGFDGDLLVALGELTKVMDTQTMAKCTAVDPTTHKCTATTTVDGTDVMAAATRALVDPDLAKTQNLVDRTGTKASTRNDGTSNVQTTPLYLLTGSISAIDQIFADAIASDPNEQERLDQWRLGRSQLVAQFLGVTGTGATSKFTDPSVPKITPTLVGMLRAQMLAHCPDTFTAPFKRCAWARDELASSLADRVKGPLFASTLDLLEGMRKDEGARVELEALLAYLVDAASGNDALAALLATSDDMLQVMQDDQNLVPIFHAISPALAPSVKDASGNVTKKSLVDAQLALLAKVSGKYINQGGTEICAYERDPNQILTQVMTRLVTPMKDKNGRSSQSPLDVIIDVIADVNRVDPSRTDKLDAADYKSITHEVNEFLLNKERGIEQFYEIVRRGTEE